MKSYTDIEQSRKLAEILPIESADMTYAALVEGMRGTLEKAMRNAGWEFDFEKKELKKLSQQEVTKISDQEKDFIEIPFGAKDSEFIEATYFIPEGCYAVIVDDTVIIKKGEKPTTWNEEDEDMLNFCCDYLDTPQATWLQTLKQRIGG